MLRQLTQHDVLRPSVYLDGFSSTATEAIWPLAILDCEEKRSAVRLLTRPLRKALKHLQLNGCVLPEEYSRHFYDETDFASWKTTCETSDVLAEGLSHCAHLSGQFRADDEKDELAENRSALFQH